MDAWEKIWGMFGVTNTSGSAYALMPKDKDSADYIYGWYIAFQWGPSGIANSRRYSYKMRKIGYDDAMTYLEDWGNDVVKMESEL